MTNATEALRSLDMSSAPSKFELPFIKALFFIIDILAPNLLSSPI